MQVGFIGLGTMGASMAANLQKAGYKLVVYDVQRQNASHHIQAGAQWAATPRAVAESCEVVFLSLPGPPEVEAVALGVDGLIAGFKTGSACFDLSTNSPTLVRRIEKVFAERGMHFLDAPVSGGPAGAKSGKLAIWVGGDKAIFDKHKAVLDAFSDAARYVGPIGAGSVAKLVHNCAGYAILAVQAEVFTMGVKAGIEPLALWSAVRQGAFGRKRSFDRLAEQFLINKFDPPAFALELAHKDVTLATEVGREFHVPMKLCNTVLGEMTEAMNREGWPKRDSRIFMTLQEERAGVSVRVPAEKLKGALD